MAKNKTQKPGSLERLVRRLADRWILVGVTHTYRGCGGRILIERNGSGQWRYEAFCEKCQACDPNGHPTLKKTVAEAREYFAPNSVIRRNPQAKD